RAEAQARLRQVPQAPVSQPGPPDPSGGGPPGPPSRPVPTGWRLWLAGARPRTLPAAVVPVLVGTAAAAGVAHAGTTTWFMVSPNAGVLVGQDVSSGLR